jgi:hypothetical protein
MKLNRQRKKSLLDDSDDEDDVYTTGLLSQNSNIQQLVYKESHNDLKKYQDPLIWWKENKNKFSAVAILAKKYLYVVSISVPSERLFSQAGQLIS